MSIGLVSGVQGSGEGYIDPTQNMTSSEYIDYINNQVNEGTITVEDALNSLKERLKQYAKDSIDHMKIITAMNELSVIAKAHPLSLDESLAEFQNRVQTLSNGELQSLIDVCKNMKDIDGIDMDNINQFLEILKAEQERRQAGSLIDLFSKN